MNKISQLLVSIMVISTAGAATWNLADNFSTAANPSNGWSYGVIGGPNNTSGYANHPASASVFGFNYWWTNTPGQDNTARGFVIHNPSPGTGLNLTAGTTVWGDSFVLRPNEVALTSSIFNIPDKQAIRWTAPSNGTYEITIAFSGISYAGIGTNSTVCVALNNSTVFTDTIKGFVGSDEFTISPKGLMADQTALYTATLTLTAADTIDVFKNTTVTTTGNSVGVDITIFKTPDAPGFDVQLPLYIAPDGSDSNNGTIDSPFATIERAKNVIEWLIYNGLTEDVHVYLRQGTYCLEQPLVFTGADGDSTYTITYEAYPGETPVISGGREITGWTALGDDKYTVTIPNVADGQWWFRQLWKDGQRQQRSRWPNAGQTLMITGASSDFSTITLDRSIPQADFANNDGELVVYHNWSISRQKIVSSTVNSVTTLHPAGSIGHETLEPRAGDLAHLEHDIDFIDLPGEWHLDRTTGVLTYKASPGTNPNDSVFTAPKLEKLIEMRGTRSDPIENVIFKGLCFKYAQWQLPEVGYAGIQACHYSPIASALPTYIVPAAIELYYAKNCEIENCLIKNIGPCAVAFGMSTEQCKIINSEITDIGANGIMNGYRGTSSDNTVFNGTGSIDWPDPALQTPKNTTISNNYIHKTAAELFGGVAVWSAFAKDTQITNNIVADTPYTGISIGFRWDDPAYSQQNTSVSANHIYDVMKILNDGGGIYTLGNQSSCILSGNLIHDVHVGWYLSWLNNAIFFDNGTSNITCSQTCTYNILGEYQTDYRYNLSEAGVTQLVNYWDIAPDSWGTAEKAIADAAGTNPIAPVLSVVLNDTNDGYLLTASCQAWANIDNAVIEETGTDITDLFTLMENGQVSAAIPASLLNTTSTATIKLTISDPDGHLAVGVWSMRNRWDVADDFSGTGDNPNAQWSYGYKTSNGAFTLLPDFGGHYYMNMSGWFINNNWQAVCMANEDDQPHEAEFWGSNYYAQPNSAYLAQTNLFGQNVVYRWTAPADGIYYLETEFAGAIYSGGETNSNVSVVVNNTNTAFNDYVQGFAGGGTHTANGVKPAASCEGTLSLATGDTVDFIQTDRNSAGNDITRLSASLTLLGSVESYSKGDFNFDGSVNNDDLYTLALYWLEAYNADYYLLPLGDITNDRMVDLRDFMIIAEEWLK